MSQLDLVLRHPLVRNAIRYGLVGAIVNTALYILYLVASIWLALSPLVSTTIVYVLGVSASYAANSIWAFKSSASHLHSAPRYLVAYAAGYGVQAGVLITLTSLSVVHYIAQLFAMACAAATIFLLLNFWVFGRGRQS